MTRIGSLCTGYGGLDQAVVDHYGGSVSWQVEYAPAPSAVLAHHAPDVPNLGDAWSVDWSSLPPIDVLTAGYPCQPFSHAGLRKGERDARHLWPAVVDAIRGTRPRRVVLENVRGHLSIGFDAVLSDLSACGFDARWAVIRASDVGAPHERARLFIVAEPADAASERRAEHDRQARSEPDGRGEPARGGRGATDADGERRAESGGRNAGGEAGAGSGSGTGGPAAPTADADRDADRGRADGGGILCRRCAPAAHSTADDDTGHGPDDTQDQGRADRRDTFGPYAPAVVRWERIMRRSAPVPVLTLPDGRRTLSPAFVEWMQGLPAGTVTCPGIGLSRSAALTVLGNGVVPQQAAHALAMLDPAGPQW